MESHVPASVQNGRQFDKLSDLRDTLREEWENITIDELKILANFVCI